MEETIEQLLQEKYGEPFTVVSAEYSKGKGMYEIKAFPINNSVLKFEANYREKDQYLQSFYPPALWESQATQNTKKHLAKTLSKFVNRTVVSFPQKDRTFNPVPAFTQLVRKEPESMELTTRIYIFEDIHAGNYAQLLKGLREHMIELHGYGTKKNLFFVHFFDEQFFKDKDLSSYDFGYNVIRPEGFETKYMNQCQGKLMVRLQPGDEVPNEQQLFDALLPNCKKHKWMSL